MDINMIIDTFCYFNEKELLELRIRMLYDYVDKFIICEGDRTHKGDYKGFTLQRVLEGLDIPQDKIQIIEVQMPSYEEQPNAWVRERMQRDAAAAYIKSTDVCIVSDLDEIPDPKKINLHIAQLSRISKTVLFLDMYNLQQRADLEVYIKQKRVYWRAAYICKGSTFTEHTMSQLREHLTLGRVIHGFKYKYAYEADVPHVAGWHFSWMGDNVKKLESFLHWDEFTQLYENQDILGRDHHTLVEFSKDSLPKEITELPHIKKYLLP